MRKAYFIDDLCRECGKQTMFSYDKPGYYSEPIQACADCRSVWIVDDEEGYVRADWSIDTEYDDREDQKSTISYWLRIAIDVLTDPAASATLPE